MTVDFFSVGVDRKFDVTFRNEEIALIFLSLNECSVQFISYALIYAFATCVNLCKKKTKTEKKIFNETFHPFAQRSGSKIAVSSEFFSEKWSEIGIFHTKHENNFCSKKIANQQNHMVKEILCIVPR